MISVVVPAHDEEARIGDCLDALTRGARPDELDVVVVANGCRDRTAAIARGHGPPVRVIELPTASKVAALNAGDDAATGFPRFYVDADVVIDWRDVRRIATRLDDAPTALAAPSRVWQTAGRPWPVRSYHRLLDRLPQVSGAVAGRGVLAVTRAGRARFGRFPDVLADDRFLETRFAPHERTVVADAHSVVATPMTLPDLVRRRTRVVSGNRQLRDRSEAPPSSPWRDLAAAVRARPGAVLDVPVFLGVSAAARLRARRVERAGPAGWARDRSTR